MLIIAHFTNFIILVGYDSWYVMMADQLIVHQFSHHHHELMTINTWWPPCLCPWPQVSDSLACTECKRCGTVVADLCPVPKDGQCQDCPAGMVKTKEGPSCEYCPPGEIPNGIPQGAPVGLGRWGCDDFFSEVSWWKEAVWRCYYVGVVQ